MANMPAGGATIPLALLRPGNLRMQTPPPSQPGFTESHCDRRPDGLPFAIRMATLKTLQLPAAGFPIWRDDEEQLTYRRQH